MANSNLPCSSHVSNQRQLPLTSATRKQVSASAGYAHTMFLTSAGALFACGHGLYGQLGLGKKARAMHAIQTLTATHANCRYSLI